MTFIGLLFLFIILSLTDAQITCTDRRAVCIPIRQCPSVMTILEGPKPLSQETVEALRELQCGGNGHDPFVCCILEDVSKVEVNPSEGDLEPKNVDNTCTDRRAVCIGIRQCPSVMAILEGPKPLSQKTVEALRELQCGGNGHDPFVCCILEVNRREGDLEPKNKKKNNTCTDRRAVCIGIRQCPSVMAILKGPKPLSQKTVEALRELQCGGYSHDPFVCCVLEIDPPVTDRIDIPNPPDVTNHPNLRLLDHESCGPLVQQKLLGGNKTGVFDYPWMALLMYNTGKLFPEFLCGGTIITNRYILTAAHCITELFAGASLIGIRVGDHNLRTERDCDRDSNGNEIQCADLYQDFAIENTYLHPEFSSITVKNDIALIKLNSTIDFRPFNVRPICLPIGNAAILNRDKAIVTGWGMTEFGLRSQSLLQAKLPLVDNESCKKIFRRVSEIGYKQMCAGGQNQVDSCTGDSGGPLQAVGTYNGNTRIIQYGVVSFGSTPCGINGIPGVYTRVTYYMDWILNTISN